MVKLIYNLKQKQGSSFIHIERWALFFYWREVAKGTIGKRERSWSDCDCLLVRKALDKEINRD